MTSVPYIDLFGGIGGFRLGIQGSMGKATCEWYCDNDKYATAIYNHNFGEDWKPTDIRDVHVKDIPDHRLLAAGFPCQSHSWAGKRQGFCDPRGQLFFEIERIIRHHQPEIIFLENVKGLLSSGRGRVFARILDTLRDCGYMGEWCCVNSTAFVPQNRERIYIVGYLGGEPRGALLPFADRDGEPYRTCVEAQEKRKRLWGYPANTLQQRDYKSGAMQFVVQPRPCLTKNRWGKEPNGRYFGDVGEPMFSLTTQNNKGVCIQRTVRPAIHACLTPERQQKRQDGRRFKDAEEPMFTLTSSDTHGVLVNDGIEYTIRKLTPLEYERLQGFPDNWTATGTFDGEEKSISKSQRYRVCGNAVSVPVVSAISRHLWNVMGVER